EEFINAGFNVSELKDLSELTKADGAFDLPDMIVYMPALNENDTANMVKARAAGTYFVSYMKKSLCGRIGKENNLYSKEMKLYAGADGVICPTAADEEIIKRAGIPACRFEKKISLKEGRVISSLKRPDIVWTGRLDDPDNNLTDAFEILREVRKGFPETRLIVFGRSADDTFQSRIDGEISFQNVEGAVIFAEDETRFAEYASEASVYLSTASCQALDAGFEKAITFGLPIVAYEIPGNPYLEDPNISISVGSGDRLAAINAVTALFEHPEIKAFLGKNAGSWVQRDKSGDIAERLRSFCASVKNEAPADCESDQKSEVCDVLLKVIDRLTEQNRIDKEYLMQQIKE
ncbi:MAG: glycosyltransferase, partial [Lachnospiraceae bacterium]|nr:glycosyltransferase [Lachnospiraceae bacterium]